MRSRHPVLNFLFVLVIAQALASQALFRAWAGASSVSDQGALTLLCSSVGGGTVKGTAPVAPASHENLHDCLATCANGVGSALPAPTALQPITATLQAVISPSPQRSLRVAHAKPGSFLARAPPVAAV